MERACLGERFTSASDPPHELIPAATSFTVAILTERTDLSDTQKRKLLADNARRLYRLP